MSPTPEEGPLSLAAQMVRALLERHGIAKHRHAAFVGEFFNLSRAAAHQRVNRSAAWTLEELSSLAQHFGETLSGIVAAHATSTSKRATLRMGGANIDCRIWLAEGTPDSEVDAFVAMENGGIYGVVPITTMPSTPASVNVQRIARMEITLQHQPTATMRIAVLDDEDDVAHSLCDQLRSAGLEAVPFSRSADLIEAMTTRPYDGYVLDWLLAEGNATPLLATLRAQAQPAAVVLLSGKLRSGSADPVDVASAAMTYRVQVIEKPTHLPLLLSALENDGLRRVRDARRQA
jgi:CheY-like chemotaxis protein